MLIFNKFFTTKIVEANTHFQVVDSKGGDPWVQKMYFLSIVDFSLVKVANL